jgi:putative NADH-flavin reductase
MLKIVVVAAAGGLGRELVTESLSRGHSVSVLVRDRAKLAAALPAEALSKLASVHVGDGTDATAVATAVKGQDVVIGARGGDPQFARIVAEQTKLAGARKFIFVAGGTNIQMEDGTLGVDHWAKLWPPARAAYAAHQACIDAIRATEVNSIVFCPGLMKSLGAKSDPRVPVRTRYPADPSYWGVSYEDAASAILDAAEATEFDGKHITAVTPADQPKKQQAGPAGAGAGKGEL